MMRHERQDRIVKLVQERKSWSVENLRKELGVSQVTLYRDLKELNERNLIHRVHGGVVDRKLERIESRFSVRLETEAEAKYQIGRRATEYVEEGSSVFVDASSTCYVFAQELAARRLSRLTLVTNSPQVPLEYEAFPAIRVICTGGELLHAVNAFAGPLALDILSQLHFDAAFVSCAGFSPADGATTDFPPLADVIRKAAANSRQVYLLTDSSKFSRRGLITSLAVEQIDRLITDERISEATRQGLQEVGLEPTIA